MTVSERATALRVLREVHDESHYYFDGMKAQDVGQDCSCKLGQIYRFIKKLPASKVIPMERKKA